ncbi:c-type cytochrome [Undibacterium sp. Ren11W]|uniref:SorU family sulfite dehydrogenase c-type cytochrome subunit n=1 Tax=Undibacterium sp. Ren11W TaxID=3413045 RepID=UPI003BF0A938
MMYPSSKKLLKILMLAALVLPAQTLLAQDTLEAGKKLFNETAVPACALCHRLKHADAAGEIGPVLDELRPDADRVEKAIRNGIGQMPAFTTLSENEIKLLAKYVSEVAGK